MSRSAISSGGFLNLLLYKNIEGKAAVKLTAVGVGVLVFCLCLFCFLKKFNSYSLCIKVLVNTQINKKNQKRRTVRWRVKKKADF